jgi:hypothetical protein
LLIQIIVFRQGAEFFGCKYILKIEFECASAMRGEALQHLVFHAEKGVLPRAERPHVAGRNVKAGMVGANVEFSVHLWRYLRLA